MAIVRVGWQGDETMERNSLKLDVHFGRHVFQQGAKLVYGALFPIVVDIQGKAVVAQQAQPAAAKQDENGRRCGPVANRRQESSQSLFA